jgi:hypothetical protein
VRARLEERPFPLELPEQINPSTGESPQAFSHSGVIFSGVALAAAQGQP